MIKITLPAYTVDDAIAVRDRVKGLILITGETAVIVNGGVTICTDDPLRVCKELSEEGFF